MPRTNRVDAPAALIFVIARLVLAALALGACTTAQHAELVLGVYNGSSSVVEERIPQMFDAWGEIRPGCASTRGIPAGDFSLELRVNGKTTVVPLHAPRSSGPSPERWVVVGADGTVEDDVSATPSPVQGC